MQRLQILKLWGGLLLAEALGGLLVWLLVPTRPPQSVTGVVTGLGMGEGRRGSYRIAIVQIDGASVQARLGGVTVCRLGDQASLTVRPLPLGRQTDVMACRPNVGTR